MSSASPRSDTRLRMKLRSRLCSRSIASEIRWSCSASIHCLRSTWSIYSCRRVSETNILEQNAIFAGPAQRYFGNSPSAPSYSLLAPPSRLNGSRVFCQQQFRLRADPQLESSLTVNLRTTPSKHTKTLGYPVEAP